MNQVEPVKGSGPVVGERTSVAETIPHVPPAIDLEAFPGCAFRLLESPTGRFTLLSMNHASEVLTGYPRSAFLNGGIAPDEVVHADDRPRLLQEFQACKVARRTATVEYRLVRADGAIRHVREHACPTPMDNGWCIWDGITIDLSDHVHAKAELQASEERYRRVTDTISDVIALCSMQGVFEWISPSVRQQSGFEPEALIGKPAYDYVHPDDRAMIASTAHVALLEGRQGFASYRSRRADGSYFLAECYSSVVHSSTGERQILCVIRDVTKRLETEAALRQSEQRYRTTFEMAPVGIVRCGPAGEFVDMNERFCEIVGYSREELLGRRIDEITHPSDAALERDMAGRLGERQLNTFSLQKRLIRRSGVYVWVDARITLAYSADGAVESCVMVVQDITGRRRTEEALRESEARYRTVVATLAEGVILQDRLRFIRACNPGAERILGVPATELYGRSDTNGPWQFLSEDGEAVHDTEHPVAIVLATGRAVTDRVLALLRPDGKRLWVSVNSQPLFRSDDERPYGVVSSFFDITDRREAEERLRHMAFYDNLTGLPNRSLFMRRLQDAMTRSADDPRLRYAVLFIDVDRLKLVNDSLGHTVGDRFLCSIADRLTACLRPGATAARLGGDEFTVLLEGIDHTQDAVDFAERLHTELSRPVHLEHHELFSTASIGIAVGSADYANPQDILRDADTALYRAKAHGRGRHALFDPSMHAEVLRRLQLENDLQRTVERQEFGLLYQPIVCLTTGQMMGVEALLRWTHPTQGTIQPEDFIPLAEDTGLIVPLGYWVLERACRQMRYWHARFPAHQALRLSVNLSSRQFAQVDLCDRLTDILDRTALPSRMLHLEITETMMMAQGERTNTTLSRLCDLGVVIELDDFGVGYSSLSYLHRFPLHTIKIDKIFVRGLGSAGSQPAIVSSILVLAGHLSLDTVAEGVEQIEQVNALRRLGCKYAQGFYFAPPLTAEQIEERLSTGASWPLPKLDEN